MKSIAKKRGLIAIAVIALLLGSVSAYGAVKTSTGVNNTFSTGGVNIEIASYQEKDGEEVPMEGKTVVDYYGDVSYIPRVTNKAEDCYIRVDVTAETETQQIDILNRLYDIGEEWELINGHLYYTQALENGQSVDICKGFDVPDEWDYMTSNDMKINVEADAIQAKNFTPDFTSDSPWGEVTILESQVGDGYTVNAAGKTEGDGNIKVVYANEVAGITINSDNFFEDVTFMPGDEYSDSIRLSNTTGEKATVLFKTEFEESRLLNMMQMDIDNGSAFYTGPVASDSLKEYQEIVVLEPGEQKEINVTLSLPETADNSYQVTNDKSTWYFAIQQEPTSLDHFVKTGDGMLLWLFAALCFASAILIFVMSRQKSCEK